MYSFYFTTVIFGYVVIKALNSNITTINLKVITHQNQVNNPAPGCLCYRAIATVSLARLIVQAVYKVLFHILKLYGYYYQTFYQWIAGSPLEEEPLLTA